MACDENIITRDEDNAITRDCANAIARDSTLPRDPDNAVPKKRSPIKEPPETVCMNTYDVFPCDNGDEPHYEHIDYYDKPMISTCSKDCNRNHNIQPPGTTTCTRCLCVFLVFVLLMAIAALTVSIYALMNTRRCNECAYYRKASSFLLSNRYGKNTIQEDSKSRRQEDVTKTPQKKEETNKVPADKPEKEKNKVTEDNEVENEKDKSVDVISTEKTTTTVTTTVTKGESKTAAKAKTVSASGRTEVTTQSYADVTTPYSTQDHSVESTAATPTYSTAIVIINQASMALSTTPTPGKEDIQNVTAYELIEKNSRCASFKKKELTKKRNATECAKSCLEEGAALFIFAHPGSKKYCGEDGKCACACYPNTAAKGPCKGIRPSESFDLYRVTKEFFVIRHESFCPMYKEKRVADQGELINCVRACRKEDTSLMIYGRPGRGTCYRDGLCYCSCYTKVKQYGFCENVVHSLDYDLYKIQEAYKLIESNKHCASYKKRRIPDQSSISECALACEADGSTLFVFGRQGSTSCYNDVGMCYCACYPVEIKVCKGIRYSSFFDLYRIAKEPDD